MTFHEFLSPVLFAKQFWGRAAENRRPLLLSSRLICIQAPRRWALRRSCAWSSTVGEPGASVSLCNGTEKYPSYAETMIDRCWYTKRIPARGRTRNKNKTVVPDLLAHFFRPIKYETQDCIISHLPLPGVDCGKVLTHTNTKSDKVRGNHLRHEDWR
jgi:hypothetical protein